MTGSIVVIVMILTSYVIAQEHLGQVAPEPNMVQQVKRQHKDCLCFFENVPTSTLPALESSTMELCCFEIVVRIYNAVHEFANRSVNGSY